MSLLNFSLESLFSQSAEALIPSDKSFDFTKSKSRFDKWTGQEASKIYSGYRADILKSNCADAIIECCNELRQKAKTLIVCGIGGSSLGAQSVLSALRKTSSVVFLDNLDTFDYEQKINDINLSEAALIVISKSGGTLESLVNASRVLSDFKKQNISFQERTAVVTTHGKGPLFEWASDEGLRSFPIPEAVGGRFSLMTPVGLVPLAFAGVDIKQLLKGACQEIEKPNDQLWKLALRLEEFEKAGFKVLSIWTYANVMFEWGRWFQQLWGESLGKANAQGVGGGMFPAACVGANDQHSLLQFLIEGTPRCVNGFLTIDSWHDAQDWKVELPAQFQSKLKFAHGKSYSALLNAEAVATQKALDQVGRPNFGIKLKKVDELNLGALFASAMDLTVMSGSLKNINPFDQSGVEIGKQLLPGVLES